MCVGAFNAGGSYVGLKLTQIILRQPCLALRNLPEHDSENRETYGKTG